MARRKPLANRRREQARRQRLWTAGVLAALVLGVIALAILYFLRDEPGEAFASEGNSHLAVEPATYVWRTRPPTSGPHAPQIARWGEHSETVPEWLQVHNLEDGGVIIHYNCPEGCPESVEVLREILNELGTNQLILHPYENMDARFAVTAWTRRLLLDELDRDAIVHFIQAYRGIDHH